MSLSERVFYRIDDNNGLQHRRPLENHTNVDDALDVFPTHGVGGIFGTILTGVFVHGLLAGDVKVFLIHILAVVIVCAYSFIVSYILYWITNK